MWGRREVEGMAGAVRSALRRESEARCARGSRSSVDEKGGVDDEGACDRGIRDLVDEGVIVGVIGHS